MKTYFWRTKAISYLLNPRGLEALAVAGGLGLAALTGAAADSPGPTGLEVGIGVRDITPELPIWLAGYAARTRAADRVDQPLVVQALALRNAMGERFVFVALDNCEVSAAFNEPLLRQLEERHQLKRGEIMIVSSHTHSAPVLEGPLEGMYPLDAQDRERLHQYGQLLRTRLIEAVDAALLDLRPAWLESGTGRATFAMNRRVYRGNQVTFGENPDGPVDREVPVLRIRDASGATRAVMFGYACHATSIHGDDFYVVSPDYPGYARSHLEALLPGTVAIFLTGMGADSNPSPRGTLLDSKRHGLELAGAVMGVLNRPMRPVSGPFCFTYTEVDLALSGPPSRERIEQDRQSENVYVQRRAASYLERLDRGEPASIVRLPVSVLRLGNELTFIGMGGEVVVDYAVRFRRLFAAEHPWPVGYAYHVPCYIPSARILLEGGYEGDSSLVYYNLYGPFQPGVEETVVSRVQEMVAATRAVAR